MTKTRPKPRRREPDTIADQLRAAIRDSGLSAYALAQLAVLDRGVILRFLARDRGMSLESAARVAAALELELTPARVQRPRPRRPARPAATSPESDDVDGNP